MSSLIAANSSEGESILPEVEELSEFHPDQLTSLVDIQEELERLEASENVGVEEVISMSTVDDVDVVDHEVTIGAEQDIEDMVIIPDIGLSEIDHASEHFINQTSFDESSSSNNVDENLDIGETITIGMPSISGTKFDILNGPTLVDINKCKAIPFKSAASMNQATPHLKAIRPLPEALKGKTPNTVSVIPPKKNILTKVIFSPNNQSALDSPMIFGEAGGQAIRIVGQTKTILSNSPKTITLAQAKEMGLLSPGKMHILPSQSKGVIKKGLMMSSNKTLTMVKSSPTKILPLPSGQLHPIAPSPTMGTLTGAPHKIFIRQAQSGIKPGTFSGTIVASNAGHAQGQILQIPVSQDNSNNQIHQIQLPGKQVQYVRLVSSAATNMTNAFVSNTGPVDTSTKTEPMLITSVNNTSARPVPIALSTKVSQLGVVPIAPAQAAHSPTTQSTHSFERVLVSPGLSQLTDTKSPANNIVMVPAEYVKQYKPVSVANPPASPTKQIISKPEVPTTTTTIPANPPLLTKAKEVLSISNKEAITPQPGQKAKVSTDPPNGIRPRKPCNCTKSQCLKLYCDCFANGEFCFQCNCNSCFNNLDHEEERQRAIKACLERNPNAFRPKIGKGYVGDERRHNKGCNCKRSGCLKNYCECYEAKIPCSNNCKCIGCRNIEENKDARDNNCSEGSKTTHQIAIKSKLSTELQESAYRPHPLLSNQGTRQPFSLMTQEVVEATCQCLLAQVEGDKQLPEQVERLILEEFGKCLVEIINCAKRTAVNSVT